MADAAAVLLLLASSSMSVGAGGVYACSGGSFDVTKFDLKTCDVSVFKKVVKKISKDLNIPTETVTKLLGDDAPSGLQAETSGKTEAQIQAEKEAETSGKTEAQIQAEKEAEEKENERQRILKMPPDTIDRKPGIVPGVETMSDPSWVNASPEDCWSIVKDEDEYGGIVGWGHRNENHPDPNLRNTCFVYTRNEDGTGMAPFNGDTADLVNISGCHKPELKLSEGCMTKDEKEHIERLKLMPPENIDRVFGMPTGVKIESDPSWVGMSAEDCFNMASEAGIDAGVRAWGYRTSDYKDKKLRNTCFLYRDGDFVNFDGTDDKTIITGCVGPDMKVSKGCMSSQELLQEIQSKGKAQQALALAAAAAKMAEKLAKEAVEKVARAAKVAAAAVKQAAQETARRVAQAANAVKKVAEDAARKAKEAAQYAARKTKEAAEAVAKQAKQAAEYAARKTVEAAKQAANAVKNAAVRTANAVKQVAQRTAQQAVAAARVAAQAAKQAATQVARAAKAAAEAAARVAQEAARKAAEAAKRAAEETARRAREAAAAVKRAAEETARKAKEAAEATKRAAEEAARRIASAAKSVAKAFKKW